MITPKEVKEKAEKEVKKIADEIFNRIEKKLTEKMEDKSALNEFLANGSIYVGYSLRIKGMQKEFGYEKNSDSWNVLREKAEKIVKEKIENSGWMLDEDYLVPKSENKEEE